MYAHSDYIDGTSTYGRADSIRYARFRFKYKDLTN